MTTIINPFRTTAAKDHVGGHRENESLRINITGASAKSIHYSMRASLSKPRANGLDSMYIYWQNVGGNGLAV